MTFSEYLSLPETPAENSPVGKLMATILKDSPGTTFEDARRSALDCLAFAAKGRNYRIRSPKQREASRMSIVAHFRKAVAKAQLPGTPPVPNST